MPAGNHHYLPSGIWWTDAKVSTVPRLLAKSCGKLSALAATLFLYNLYRNNAHDNVYNSFNGKTLTLGSATTATHEPASVEEIDRLMEEMYARKRAKLGIS